MAFQYQLHFKPLDKRLSHIVQMKYVYEGKKCNTNTFNSFTDGILKVSSL